MKRNSGNALLVVTLLSVGMVLTAMGLVSLSSGQQRTSYGLNNQVTLRYAAEGTIEETKLRLYRDKNEAPTGTWYLGAFRSGLSAADLNAYNANTASGPYTAIRPAFSRTFGDPGQGQRQLQVDVYFDKTAGADEFVARAVAFVVAEGQSRYSMQMRMIFRYTASQTIPPGQVTFSRYALFMNNWDSNLWFGHEHYDGYVHSNSDVQFLFKDARFYRELTYVGNENYYWGWSWTAAEKAAMFPGGKTKLASPIPMPSLSDIQTDIRPAALNGPPALLIDPSQSTPNPWSGLTLTRVNVTFVWDSAAGQNYAYLQGFNGSTLVQTVKHAVPKTGDDTLIYTTLPVRIKGVVQGRVTVATESTANTVANPAVKITDDIVYVDDSGRPKTWVYRNGNPVPASGRTLFTDPSTGQTFTYSFSGIPTAGNPAADNVNTQTYGGVTQEWDQSSFVFRNNTNYSHTYKDPVLGMIAGGKFTLGASTPYNTIQNWAMYTPTSNYEVEQNAAKGNFAKYGSVIVNNTPWDGTYYGWGSWTGYGRQLPHLYDQHMLNSPPPFFVRIPGQGQPGPINVTLDIGAVYIGTLN